MQKLIWGLKFQCAEDIHINYIYTHIAALLSKENKKSRRSEWNGYPGALKPNSCKKLMYCDFV